MKSITKKFLCIVLLLVSSIVGNIKADCTENCGECAIETLCPIDCPKPKCGANVYGHTFWNPRPIHQNEARRMMGVEDKIHLFNKGDFYGVASLTLAYGQTNKSNKIGEFFSFVQTSTNKKTNSNKMTYGANDGKHDIYNVEFGTTSSGIVCLNPEIKNFIADLDMFVGWDECVCGLWSRVGIPVNTTTWEFNILDSTGEGEADEFYEDGEVTLDPTEEVAVVNQNLKEGFAGLPFGDVPALQYAKVCGKRSQTQVSGLIIDLGYDFIRREMGHFALGVHFAAPTGTKPEAKWLFEPVSGSCLMWEIGGTVNTGFQWHNCDCDKGFGIYLDAVIDHEFGAEQKRTFSLLKPSDGSKNAGSQYFILKKFDSTGTTVLSLERAANITTTNVKIKCDLMADVGVMLQFDVCDFSVGVGYEFWIRTKEKIDCYPAFPSLTDETVKFAVKPAGLDSAIMTNTTTATENSTIGFIINDSTQTFLTIDDIDLCSALHPQALSNKVFGFVGYNLKDCRWEPYILVGGEVEFGNNNVAANEWFVDLKGGIAF